MTSTQLLDFYKKIINIEDDTAFSNTKNYLYLTTAQEEIFAEIVSRNLGFFETTQNIDFEANTQEYDLPDNIYMNKLVSVEYQSDIISSGVTKKYKLYKIDKSDRESFNDIVDLDANANLYSGDYYEKLVFYLTGDKIGFVPPSRIANTDAIILTFIQEPEDIDEDTNPTLPKAFHKLIGLKAGLLALGIQDNDDINNLMALYKLTHDRLFKALTDRVFENPQFFKIFRF